MSLQKPLSTMSAKVALLFFSLIITSTMFYLFWDDKDVADEYIGGGEELGIDQDIETGFPDF